MSFNLNIEKQLVDQAIKNSQSINYPIIVTGQDYGDDLAYALGVIKTLLIEVDKLSRVVNKLQGDIK
jgi:hypothetical protein